MSNKTDEISDLTGGRNVARDKEKKEKERKKRTEPSCVYNIHNFFTLVHFTAHYIQLL